MEPGPYSSTDSVRADTILNVFIPCEKEWVIQYVLHRVTELWPASVGVTPKGEVYSHKGCKKDMGEVDIYPTHEFYINYLMHGVDAPAVAVVYNKNGLEVYGDKDVVKFIAELPLWAHKVK